MRDYTDLTMMVNGRFRFSEREHQVAAMLADGFGERAISQHLGMRRDHLRNTIGRCLRRNGLKNRQQLIRVYSGFDRKYLEEVMPDNSA